MNCLFCYGPDLLNALSAGFSYCIFSRDLDPAPKFLVITQCHMGNGMAVLLPKFQGSDDWGCNFLVPVGCPEANTCPLCFQHSLLTCYCSPHCFPSTCSQCVFNPEGGADTDY